MKINGRAEHQITAVPNALSVYQMLRCCWHNKKQKRNAAVPAMEGIVTEQLQSNRISLYCRSNLTCFAQFSSAATRQLCCLFKGQQRLAGLGQDNRAEAEKEEKKQADREKHKKKRRKRKETSSEQEKNKRMIQGKATKREGGRREGRQRDEGKKKKRKKNPDVTWGWQKQVQGWVAGPGQQHLRGPAPRHASGGAAP